MRYLALISGLSLLLSSFVSAQEQTNSLNYTTFTSTLTPYVPSGQATQAASFDSPIPLTCEAGCAEAIDTYYYCFVNTTLPNGLQDNIIACLEFLCVQPNYDLFSSCLNCIVANGNQQPLGYYSNSALTSASTQDPSSPLPYNPNALINSTIANQMLLNVTDRCLAANLTLNGSTTVTATPTTTGAYYTSWSSGATVSISVWTGLTSYTSAIAQAYESQTVNVTSPLATGGSTTSSGGASGSSGASASASKSAAFRAVNVPQWATLFYQFAILFF